MKILTWNVNGLRSVYKKGFLDFVGKERPDILCLQEIKAQEGQLQKLPAPAGYFSFFNCAERKGYSGVAVFTKENPQRVEDKIGLKRFDSEGRFLKLKFPQFTLMNLYLPHGARDKSQLGYKLDVYKFFLSYLAKLKNLPVVMIGDFNIAHQEIDLARPRENQNNIMFTLEERRQIDALINMGFADAFRVFHKGGGHYTWFGYLQNALAKGLGWRIDYCFVSKPLLKYLKDAFILKNISLGSDHRPSGIKIDVRSLTLNSRMGKVKTLSQLAKICESLRKKGKTIGLITGCFDILHLGHVKLFRFAKKQVGVLVVGVDNDKSIRLSKGKNRPIFSQRERIQMLTGLENIDYIFPVRKTTIFDSEKADAVHEEIVKKIKPNAIITGIRADRFWLNKKTRAEKLGIKFIPDERHKEYSSSKIIRLLESEL